MRGWYSVAARMWPLDWNTIWSDTVSGAVIVFIVIASFLATMNLGDFVRFQFVDQDGFPIDNNGVDGAMVDGNNPNDPNVQQRNGERNQNNGALRRNVGNPNDANNDQNNRNDDNDDAVREEDIDDVFIDHIRQARRNRRMNLQAVGVMDQRRPLFVNSNIQPSAAATSSGEGVAVPATDTTTDNSGHPVDAIDTRLALEDSERRRKQWDAELNDDGHRDDQLDAALEGDLVAETILAAAAAAIASNEDHDSDGDNEDDDDLDAQRADLLKRIHDVAALQRLLDAAEAEQVLEDDEDDDYDDGDSDFVEDDDEMDNNDNNNDLNETDRHNDGEHEPRQDGEHAGGANDVEDAYDEQPLPLVHDDHDVVGIPEEDAFDRFEEIMRMQEELGDIDDENEDDMDMRPDPNDPIGLPFPQNNDRFEPQFEPLDPVLNQDDPMVSSSMCLLVNSTSIRPFMVCVADCTFCPNASGASNQAIRSLTKP